MENTHRDVVRFPEVESELTRRMLSDVDAATAEDHHTMMLALLTEALMDGITRNRRCAVSRRDESTPVTSYDGQRREWFPDGANGPDGPLTVLLSRGIAGAGCADRSDQYRKRRPCCETMRILCRCFLQFYAVKNFFMIE